MDLDARENSWEFVVEIAVHRVVMEFEQVVPITAPAVQGLDNWRNGGNKAENRGSHWKQKADSGRRESHGGHDPAIQTTREALTLECSAAVTDQFDSRFAAHIWVIGATAAHKISVVLSGVTVTYVSHSSEHPLPILRVAGRLKQERWHSGNDGIVARPRSKLIDEFAAKRLVFLQVRGLIQGSGIALKCSYSEEAVWNISRGHGVGQQNIRSRFQQIDFVEALPLFVRIRFVFMTQFRNSLVEKVHAGPILEWRQIERVPWTVADHFNVLGLSSETRKELGDLT